MAWREFGRKNLQRLAFVCRLFISIISKSCRLRIATYLVSANKFRGCLSEQFTSHQRACEQTLSISVTKATVWRSQGKKPTSYSMYFFALCLLIGSAWLMGLPYLSARMCVFAYVPVICYLTLVLNNNGCKPGVSTSPWREGASKMTGNAWDFQCRQVVKIRFARVRN